MTTTATAFTAVADETAFDAITNKTTLFTKASNTYTRCASTVTWDGTTTYYTFDGYAALKGLYSTFTAASGVISDATAATAVTSANGIKVSGNLLSTTTDNGANWTVFTTAHIGDAVPVYVLHTVSGTVDKLTASAVTTLTNASAVYVSTSAGANVGVYVTYAN